ncbi:MAG: hypothetical protein ACOVRP_13950 [Gemmatimonas sp.]|jgi:hypothetical protein
MRALAATVQCYREARRDVLAARAARVQRALAAAQAQRQAAEQQHRDALNWRAAAGLPGADLFAQCERVQAMRPSCEALVARYAAAVASAVARQDVAQAQLAEARRAVHQQERALLRGEQLVCLLREAERRTASVSEIQHDDDLATARSWRA